MEFDIINFVKLNNFLYDKSNKLYRNITYRNEKWKEFALTINVDVNKIKKRWKTLRDSYLREKKKYINALENSIGLPEPRKSKYFEELYFLDYVTLENSDSLNNDNIIVPQKKRRGCTQHIWTTEETLKLINLLERYTDLWNPSSPNYSKREHKVKLHKAIADVIGVTAEDVEGKIHNLRCQYNGELRKVKVKKNGKDKSIVLGKVYRKRNQKPKLAKEGDNDVASVSGENVAGRLSNQSNVKLYKKRVRKNRKVKVKEIGKDENKEYVPCWEYFNALNFLSKASRRHSQTPSHLQQLQQFRKSRPPENITGHHETIKIKLYQ